jgi:hypothetical protein
MPKSRALRGRVAQAEAANEVFAALSRLAGVTTEQVAEYREALERLVYDRP